MTMQVISEEENLKTKNRAARRKRELPKTRCKRIRIIRGCRLQGLAGYVEYNQEKADKSAMKQARKSSRQARV